MKNKYLIAIISVLILLLVSGIFIYYKNNTSLNKSIKVNNGDLIFKNISKADLRVITNQNEEITVNLIGSAEELKKVVFNKVEDGVIQFSLPDDSRGIRGSVTVPQNVKIIDLDLPVGVDFIVNQSPVKKDGQFIYHSKGGSGGSGGGNTLSGGKKNGGNGGGGTGGEGEGEGEDEDDGGNNPPAPPTPPPPPEQQLFKCGDLVKDTGEECDDGNRRSGDGCSAICKIEQQAPEQQLFKCGDLVIDAGEECDDGNRRSGDGCSDLCKIEGSFCGNLIIGHGEECDDGNRINGDGCSSACKLENLQSVCGNAIIESFEECDDGNMIGGDGCSSGCRTEASKYSKCTIEIRQEERNQCCQEVNADAPHADCEGYWLFDYHTRLCFWHCPPVDCSAPDSQAERDSCCVTQNENEPTPPCAGDWIYDTEKLACLYKCTDFSKGYEHTDEEIDETTKYCTNTYTDPNDVNKCCDDYLKHPLSLGPRPGFPDCIGKWSIKPGTTQCKFECSTYEEMQEILKELKANTQQEE